MGTVPTAGSNLQNVPSMRAAIGRERLDALLGKVWVFPDILKFAL